MKRLLLFFCCSLSLIMFQVASAADTVPSDIQLPGTQPLEIGNLESPNKCDNCHGGYNSSVEPAHNWRGSMMAHAGRDPIFWATMAIAEQDFDGVGDLCIRCHSTAGWLAGRSTPTDGSGLAAGDSDGVECEYCHKLTNPNDTEHQGVMNGDFVANESDAQGGTEGYYGSGMSSMWGGSDKLGPYNDADARHQFMQSEFHRDRNFCGTCHDVSNSLVGDLAHNFGAFNDLEAGKYSGVPGGPVSQKAAFNNPPYRYGIVERTFSEFMSGRISQTKVDDFLLEEPAEGALPDDLKGGALEAVYHASYDPGTGSANYQNPPADRYYSCQSCHMRAVTGKGANKKGVPTRVDLPLHDMTGGNYWMASAIEYLDDRGKLRLGGGMTALQRQAMHDGALRAQEQLRLAASLKVEENETEGYEIKVINHTGHKLITGYPEGRRMWLNIKWFNGTDSDPFHEDGAYGPLFDGAGNPVAVRNPANGQMVQVKSILDLHDPDTKIYEAHMGMTQEWAAQLLGLGVPSDLVLKYDRQDGTVATTLNDLAAMPPGSVLPTFHFALNNTVYSDNRIPPYGMDPVEAAKRNAAPVPKPGSDEPYEVEGGVYPYYDELELSPPDGAVSASIDLLYQPTSWEYIQFLYLANDGSVPFLANEGVYMLEAWLNEGMAEPFVMASTGLALGSSEPPPDPTCDIDAPTMLSAVAGHSEVALEWSGPDSGFDGYKLYYDQSGKAQEIDIGCSGTDCTSYTDTGLSNGNEYCYKVTAFDSTADCESAFSDPPLCATPQSQGQVAYASVTEMVTGLLVRDGKGKNAPTTFVPQLSFAPGDQVVIRMIVEDAANGIPVSGAVVDLTISGPQTIGLSTSASDSSGLAEASWTTDRPNKKGAGGTPEGEYTISVSGLNSSSHDWDGSSHSVIIQLGAASAQSGRHHHGAGM